MPEFYAEHVPAKLPRTRIRGGFDFVEFVRGYLECFEWLLPDPAEDSESGIDRDKIRGWSRDALRSIYADCRDFCRANAADLAEYVARREAEGLRGYSGAACAGHDFYLTREGHGAGFWDRGLGELGDRLSKASKYGEAGYPYLSRGWLRIN